VLADPPWTFKTYSAKGKAKSPERHYDCMALADICALPVAQVAAPSSVLFLWTTGPHLQQAFKVIDAWGFTYKSMGFTWAKLNTQSLGFFKGLGYWTRGNAEFCLLATRGKPKRRSGGVNSLIVTPRREHSRKPDEIYSRIEKLLEGPYLELFARHEQLGWDAWGNEIGTV
jgi:N6-adenosine-specific RNA methylase IME4